MHTTRDDQQIAIVQWPDRLLGTGPTLDAAAKVAKRYLHPTLAANLPQISRGVRVGDIRWGYVSDEHVDALADGGTDVQLDMLHTRPGHVLVWLPEES